MPAITDFIHLLTVLFGPGIGYPATTPQWLLDFLKDLLQWLNNL